MRRLLAVLLAPVLLIGCTPPAYAQTDRFEENQITWSPSRPVVNEAGVSGGAFIRLNGNAAGTFVTPMVMTKVTVRAKANECDGWPNLRVTAGGVAQDRTVGTETWADYEFTVAATGLVKVEFTNEHKSYFLWNLLCTRTIELDYVAVNDGQADIPPPPANRYVAMGDSYSSGEGSDRTPTDTSRDNSVYAGNSCGRSTNAAPYQIAAAAGKSLKFVACGGANTNNITTTGLQSEPPQVNAANADTELITLTIGGNDAALMWQLSMCIIPGNCWRNNGDSIAASYIAQTDTKINALQAKVVTVLQALVAAAPNAVIVIAGYPPIIARPGEPRNGCSQWIGVSEQAYFDEILLATNGKIAAAVDQVKTATGRDIRYADPLAPSSPFLERDNGQMLDGCSTSPLRYMNGQDNQQGMWHPNVYGQARYALLYQSVI